MNNETYVDLTGNDVLVLSRENPRPLTEKEKKKLRIADTIYFLNKDSGLIWCGEINGFNGDSGLDVYIY